MSAFKENQCISEAKAREIEQGTRDQRLSSLWFSAHRYRITVSNFGRALSLKGRVSCEKIKNYLFVLEWPFKGADSRKNIRKIYKNSETVKCASFCMHSAYLCCTSSMGWGVT